MADRQSQVTLDYHAARRVAGEDMRSLLVPGVVRPDAWVTASLPRLAERFKASRRWPIATLTCLRPITCRHQILGFCRLLHVDGLTVVVTDYRSEQPPCLQGPRNLMSPSTTKAARRAVEGSTMDPNRRWGGLDGEGAGGQRVRTTMRPLDNAWSKDGMGRYDASWSRSR